MRRLLPRPLPTLVLASALLASCAAGPAGRPAGPGTCLVVANATLIDGSGGIPRPGTTLIVEGDRIAWIGSAGLAPHPAGAPTIDAAGKWIIPGLFDAHVHLASVQTPAGVVQEETQKLLDAFLFSGVTSILDCWATEEVFDLRRLEREGRIESPRIFATGPGLTAPEAHGTEFGIAQPVVRSEDDAREQVRRLAALGADLVKVAVDALPGDAGVRPSLEPALFRAIVSEAHRLRLRVGVHVLHPRLAEMVMREGADVILHAFPGDGFDGATLNAFRRRGGWIVPTLAVEEPLARLRDDPGFLEEPLLVAAADPRLRRLFGAGSARRLAGTHYDLAASAYPAVEETVRRFAEVGAAIAAGTDASNLGVFHGPALHREAELLVRAGLSPMQALLAATRGGPRALGLEWDRGLLDLGRLADLVVLGADPLADIRNLARVEVVVKGGRIVDREALRERIQGTITGTLPDGPFADFESEDGLTGAVSRPFGVVESGSGPHSTVDVRIAREGSGAHLVVEGLVADVPDAVAGVAMHLSPFGLHAVDLDRTPWIRFRARGDGGVCLLELITLDCGQGVFLRAFRAAEEWAPVEIKLDRLRPRFVEPGTPLDLSRALTLRVVTGEGRRGPFRVELDDIGFTAPGRGGGGAAAGGG